MSHRAVLFDLDDTLHDRTAGLVSFLRTQHEDRRLGSFGVSLEQWTTRFISLDQRGKVWKDEVYHLLCLEFGLSPSPDSLLAEYEDGFAQHVVAAEGLVEVLTSLREAGWRTGIVTNGRSTFQRRTLAALAIDRLLDAVIVSEECGLRKPDPAIFHLALSRLGCEAKNSWFVGDDFAADIGGAKGAGMNALWLHAGPSLDINIESLREVVDTIMKV